MSRRYPSLFARLVANTRVDEATGCWFWTGHQHRGYPIVTIRVNGKPRKHRAHRVMLELITGYEFPFDEAGHQCWNTLCIKPGCLRIETSAENLYNRRGYAAKDNGRRWIPVLFPTASRLLDESISFDKPTNYSPPEETTCPF